MVLGRCVFGQAVALWRGPLGLSRCGACLSLLALEKRLLVAVEGIPQKQNEKKEYVGSEDYAGGRRPGRAARDLGHVVRREDGAGDRGATVKAPIFSSRVV